MEKKIISILACTLVLLPYSFGQMSGSSISSMTYTQPDGKTGIKNIVYDNGLGDIIEEVTVGVTPDFKNLVVKHEYDGYGREIKTWLPVETSDLKVSNVSALANAQYGNDGYEFEVKTYDDFYVDKLATSQPSGKNWAKKRKSMSYNGSKILRFIEYGGYIATASNCKTRSQTFRDEDGIYATEWLDDKDRVIMRSTYNGETWYVYDYNGMLTYVIPPALSSYLEREYNNNRTSSFPESNEMVKQYAYIYHYDGMNRCIYKKLPGAEPIYYIYNKAGICIMMQDGNLRSKGEWIFTIPDQFGRECLTGVCKNTYKYTDLPLQSTCVYASYNGSSTYKGYAINGISLTSPTLHSVNYYDDYGFIGRYGSPTGLNYVADANNIYKRDANVAHGQLTGTATVYLDATGVKGYLYSAIYYDVHHNVVQTRSTNIKGGVDVTNCAYTFTGKMKSCKVEHKAGSISKAETYTYTYDHAERLTNVKHSMTGGTEKTIASNTYDRFGRMISTGHLGISALNTSYTYDIHSNVRSIKTGSAFSETLHYEDSYKGNTPKWNGGISSIEWKADATTRGYNYTYDKTDRLTAAKYLEGGTVNDKYSTSYAYDAMGNITSLTRRGKMSNGTYNQIDNLTMTYNGNQLTKVTDAVTSATASGSMDFRDGANVATEYTYDANGNMTSDLNKGITNIQYNFLNLPSKVTFSNGVTVDYTYDANGRKLKVVHAKAGKTHTMEYIGNHIYVDGVLKQTLIEGGYLTYSGNTPAYHFYVKDHLGNNRMVMSASGAVEQVVHYYPYGMAFADGTNADAQRFKYNGKELDVEDGLNWMDYGARMYDAATGRWGGVDALAEKYSNMSVYGYCGGNPVRFVDVDGRDWYLAKDGAMQYTNQHYKNQLEFDQSGLQGEWKGYTTEKDGQYYGLLGDFCIISTKNESYEFCKAMDNAIIAYHKLEEERDPFDSEIHSVPSADFSKALKNVQYQGGFFNTKRNIFSYFGKGPIEISNMNNKYTSFSFGGISNFIPSELDDSKRGYDKLSEDPQGARGIGLGTARGYILRFHNNNSNIWAIIRDKKCAETILSNYESLFKQE